MLLEMGRGFRFRVHGASSGMGRMEMIKPPLPPSPSPLSQCIFDVRTKQTVLLISGVIVTETEEGFKSPKSVRMSYKFRLLYDPSSVLHSS